MRVRNTGSRVAVGLVVALCAAFGGVVSAQGPFGPIHVATNRSSYTGPNCPIDIVYTATINFEMPHPRGFVFNYHWERSDGAKTAVQVVRVQPNQRSMVVRNPWRVGGRGQNLNLSQTIFVNSGNTHLSQGSPTVHVVCR